jgi:hypothetical protein
MQDKTVFPKIFGLTEKNRESDKSPRHWLVTEMGASLTRSLIARSAKEAVASCGGD